MAKSKSKKDYITIVKECGGMRVEKRLSHVLMKYAKFDIVEAMEKKAEKELLKPIPAPGKEGK